jgi:hypothetical protein
MVLIPFSPPSGYDIKAVQAMHEKRLIPLKSFDSGRCFSLNRFKCSLANQNKHHSNATLTAP